MGIYGVQVDVALRRPPRVDARLYYRLTAQSGLEAELQAGQWAACRPGVVMPIGAVVLDWEEDAP